MQTPTTEVMYTSMGKMGLVSKVLTLEVEDLNFKISHMDIEFRDWTSMTHIPFIFFHKTSLVSEFERVNGVTAIDLVQSTAYCQLLMLSVTCYGWVIFGYWKQ